MNVFTWKIGGAAGDGQQAAGSLFAKACARRGFYSFGYSEFPSLIRGGHVTFAVSIASSPVTAIYRTVNLLIALNDETVLRHLDELAQDGVVIYNSEKISPDTVKKADGKRKLLGIPLGTLIKNNQLQSITANIIAVGASCGLLRYDPAAIYEAIDHIFEDKIEAVRAMNKKAAEAGYLYAQKNFHPESYHYHLQENGKKIGKAILTSNQAVALGAVAAGCRVYAAYPMSPSTSILHTLADWSEKTGMLVYQPEDEIAAAHIMLGAMHAGTRSMVATSGGGFALMTESVALSAMTETPAVFAICSRPGPATGLPTWTEQGDLKFIVNCGHGDFPRVVLAPADPEEAFQFIGLAFNIAEKYQVPVFLLLDKYLSEGQQTFDDFNTDIRLERGKLITNSKDLKDYSRYAKTKDGVSPRVLPGLENGLFYANSDEHDEYGLSIEGWQDEMRKTQVEKRAAKVQGLLRELPQPKIFGPKKSRLTLIGWGSTKGPVVEALHVLPDVNYIHVPAVWPLQVVVFKKLLKTTKKLIAIENNYSGQFATILRGQTGITPDKLLLKYDGRQFWPEEIVEKVKKM